MNEFDERRKEPRKTVMKFTPVHDADKGKILGYLSDLTIQGAMVIGGKPLEVNAQIILKFDLPEEMSNIMANHLTIPARVVRCIQDEDPNSYKLGFEFKDINPEQIRIIKALLERYHFRHKRYDWQTLRKM